MLVLFTRDLLEEDPDFGGRARTLRGGEELSQDQSMKTTRSMA